MVMSICKVMFAVIRELLIEASASLVGRTKVFSASALERFLIPLKGGLAIVAQFLFSPLISGKHDAGV